MDPTETYISMLDAFGHADYELARERAFDLRTWLERGGFWPTGIPRSSVLRMIERCILQPSDAPPRQMPFLYRENQRRVMDPVPTVQ